MKAGLNFTKRRTFMELKKELRNNILIDLVHLLSTIRFIYPFLRKLDVLIFALNLNKHLLF